MEKVRKPACKFCAECAVEKTYTVVDDVTIPETYYWCEKYIKEKVHPITGELVDKYKWPCRLIRWTPFCKFIDVEEFC